MRFNSNFNHYVIIKVIESEYRSKMDKISLTFTVIVSSIEIVIFGKINKTSIFTNQKFFGSVGVLMILSYSDFSVRYFRR